MLSVIFLVTSLISVAKTTDPELSTVFKPHDGKYPCYRQPALLTTNAQRTHLLVFAEGRFVTSCAPPFENQSDGRSKTNEDGGLEMRRSEDSGVTWLPAQTVFSGNIDFYTVVWDSTTNTVYLMLQTTTPVLIFTSTDEGITWSKPIPLAVYPPPSFSKATKPAVGHGIEVVSNLCTNSNCSDAGTLLMPFVCANGSSHPGDNGSCPSCYACVLKSDLPKANHNRTWTFSGIAQQYTRESQLVQTISTDTGLSHIYLNGRNFSPMPGHRFFARSTNGANQFTKFGVDLSLIEPVTRSWTGVVCSVSRISTIPSRIVFSGPDNSTVRSNFTLRLSYDEGYTWPVSRVLFSGLSSYSDTAVLGNGDSIAVVLENGEATFADRISIAIVPVSWIERKSTRTIS
ncbi:unnamed protein product [Adineta ricciae]|uniref:Sialidase domain-containing protein n=1 Tax=Adineta ricciae TaxID=249248 RepID=A0A815EBW3_ADIRI|nr:unnamed protein product [Adineta ricciae]